MSSSMLVHWEAKLIEILKIDNLPFLLYYTNQSLSFLIWYGKLLMKKSISLALE